MYDNGRGKEELRECLQMAVRIIDVAVEKMHKEMRELGIEVGV